MQSLGAPEMVGYEDNDRFGVRERRFPTISIGQQQADDDGDVLGALQTPIKSKLHLTGSGGLFDDSFDMDNPWFQAPPEAETHAEDQFLNSSSEPARNRARSMPLPYTGSPPIASASCDSISYQPAQAASPSAGPRRLRLRRSSCSSSGSRHLSRSYTNPQVHVTPYDAMTSPGALASSFPGSPLSTSSGVSDRSEPHPVVVAQKRIIKKYQTLLSNLLKQHKQNEQELLELRTRVGHCPNCSVCSHQPDDDVEMSSALNLHSPQHHHHRHPSRQNSHSSDLSPRHHSRNRLSPLHARNQSQLPDRRSSHHSMPHSEPPSEEGAAQLPRRHSSSQLASRNSFQGHSAHPSPKVAVVAEAVQIPPHQVAVQATVLQGGDKNIFQEMQQQLTEIERQRFHE